MCAWSKRGSRDIWQQERHGRVAAAAAAAGAGTSGSSSSSRSRDIWQQEQQRHLASGAAGTIQVASWLQVLALLREETSRMQGYRMQITPEQGCLLGLLVELTGARRAVEVGVFTGYSSISIAQALPEDGHLLALDVDERTMAVARKYWELAGVAHKVEGVVGPAAMSLQDALQREGPNSYDFAFIDADKQGYDTYYEILLRLVRPGGLIVIDNVLWYGRVADPEETDKATMALKALNHKLLHDPRISLSIVPVGDGVALCRRR
ncbi:hypothetical protein QJQ45_005183 [Haematococcus lacustris]|nr:hypothetical protein QJQ45_005183 [Haematococcus lacustris]